MFCNIPINIHRAPVQAVRIFTLQLSTVYISCAGYRAIGIILPHNSNNFKTELKLDNAHYFGPSNYISLQHYEHFKILLFLPAVALLQFLL